MEGILNPNSPRAAAPRMCSLNAVAFGLLEKQVKSGKRRVLRWETLNSNRLMVIIGRLRPNYNVVFIINDNIEMLDINQL